MSFLRSLGGTATTDDDEHPSMRAYPEALDRTDETPVVECLQREYHCEDVRVDEDCPGLSLIIRSDSQYAVQPRLLRHLQQAGFGITTVTTRQRDGCYRLEVGASRYPPEAYR